MEMFFLGLLMMLPMIAGGITFILSIEATQLRDETLAVRRDLLLGDTTENHDPQQQQ